MEDEAGGGLLDKVSPSSDFNHVSAWTKVLRELVQRERPRAPARCCCIRYVRKEGRKERRKEEGIT